MDEEHLLVKVSQKALIVVGNKLLLTYEEKDWELPGGRVNKGETALTAALKREVAEELAVDIEPGAIFSANLYTKPSGEEALVITYECKLMSPIETIKPRDGEIIDWKFFSKAELEDIPNIYPNSREAINKFLAK